MIYSSICQLSCFIFFLPSSRSFLTIPSKTFSYPPTTEVSFITRLHQSSHSNQNNPKKRHISSSEHERQNEELRRLERKHDVQIGKTSAISGAKDYQMNVQQTEQDLLDNAFDKIEREIWNLTEEGMNNFKLLQLEEAHAKFARVYELKPNGYLWQYGVVLFYLGKYHEAAQIFATNASLYESKFGEPATEERIWRDACEIKLWNTLSLKQQKQCIEENCGETKPSWIAQIDTPEWEDELHGMGVPVEKRKVLRYAQELFHSTVENDLITNVVSQIKLRSITGPICPNQSMMRNKKKQQRPDWKMYKHNSWFYLGLYYDVLGKQPISKICMKMALQQNVGGMNSDDLNKVFPILHMSKRDWYDDDDFEGEDHNEHLDIGGVLSDQKEELIRAIVNDAKKTSAQDALRKEGLTISGSKSELCDRLCEFLMTVQVNDSIIG